ncbi:MAG: protein kinase [Nitrospirae bacterium]|uniref:serine/threonine-protein kinase n=1 Tax=Candidatus Magnetobacterium casense TaxID=1455061 RepID=UPI0006991F3F|nr:serine/threonine-protein kinase [Candidatus Magnetobacterium casensis]MBF0337588.1 protein kinase [Nitrospirota bacterium]
MKRFNLLYNTTMGLTHLGRYKILHELGHGAMGVVYKGNDTIIDRTVAIKTIKLGKVLSSFKEKELLALFYQEVRIAGKLAHPNIAMIYDAGQHYDIHYFVMEHVSGISLKSVITDKLPLTLDDKVRILTIIANALHYAHQRGVIHRDIKPANIMLLEDYQAKIMDFGIAMLSTAKDAMARPTQDKILGTPSYMSPEQISGQDLDRLTDVFSLGAMAYEFITGRKAFPASDITSLFHKIKTEDPIAPHFILPEVDKTLSDCIMGAMKKNKEERFQSASEFADALVIFLNKSEKEGSQSARSPVEYANKDFLLALKKSYAFFSDFTLEELHTIIKISKKNTFKADEVIFKENTIGNTMYIIISGQIRITKVFSPQENPTLLNRLKVGDCFGEMAIMESAPRFATAICETDCILIAINEVVLRNSEPRLCLKLYRNLAIILSDKLRKSDAKVNALLAKQSDS